MIIRAFIFDIYNTLLEIGPGPTDTEARWARLWQRVVGSAPELSLPEFVVECEEAIAFDHLAATGRGVQCPEVYWPDITRAVAPALNLLSPNQLDQFLYEHAQLERTVRLMPGADRVLAELCRRGTMLGICSNSQPYTLRELGDALTKAGLTMAIFDPGLCFYSFQAGFSKPDPKAFRVVQQELSARSVSLAEALLVGDRLDNDIRPAQAEGWRTWHLSVLSNEPEGGNWNQLLQFIQE